MSGLNTVASLDAPPDSTSEGHRIAADLAHFATYLQETKAGSEELTRLIVEGAVKLIPGADFAAVLSMTGKRTLRSDISTGEQLPGRLLDLQNSLGEGPCLDAIDTGVQTRVADMTVEARWPAFAPAAAGLGVVGMLSTPMALSGHTTASLTLIGTTIAFDDEAVGLATIFAVHAAIALSGAIRQEALTAALANRETIGKAKGILMERFKMTEEVAFAALVKVSADNNMKLHAVCLELCNSGVLLPTQPKKVRPPRR
jgi:GAF domain-containing protein